MFCVNTMSDDLQFVFVCAGCCFDICSFMVVAIVARQWDQKM